MTHAYPLLPQSQQQEESGGQSHSGNILETQQGAIWKLQEVIKLLVGRGEERLRSVSSAPSFPVAYLLHQIQVTQIIPMLSLDLLSLLHRIQGNGFIVILFKVLQMPAFLPDTLRISFD